MAVYNIDNRNYSAISIGKRSGLTNNVQNDIIKENKKKNILSSNKKSKSVQQSTSVNVNNGSMQWSDEKRTRLRQHEQILNGNKYETAVVYTKDGNVSFKKKGDFNSVKFTQKEVQQMKDCVITHNHPSNSCFSPEDINLLRLSNAAEMRASTQFGTYVINRTPVWDKNISTLKDINDEYNKFLDDAILKAKDRAAQEGKHILTYLQEAEVEGTEMFCKKYGLKFRMERYDEK